MYLDRSHITVNGKTYHRVLLRQSFRQEGKVKHRTIANLSACSDQEINAIALAFQHKKDLDSLQPSLPGRCTCAKGFASAPSGCCTRWPNAPVSSPPWVPPAKAPWPCGKSSLAPWTRAPASAPSAWLVPMPPVTSCNWTLLTKTNLYPNLAWLAENQVQIEQRLFAHFHPHGCPDLFLYDVTSSYLEGDHNALAAWGYNRDGKPGKKQIVLGLLCDGQGRPLSIEVFAGNTSDPKTFGSQIRKAVERFGGQGVTFVGDRGMIKGPQIKDLGQENFHYITAITKPQIEALLQQNVLAMDLFDDLLSEVASIPEKVRYILRRNPQRAAEMAAVRHSKRAALEKLVQAKNALLQHEAENAGPRGAQSRPVSGHPTEDRWLDERAGPRTPTGLDGR